MKKGFRYFPAIAAVGNVEFTPKLSFFQQLHVVGGEQAVVAVRAQSLPPAFVDLVNLADDVVGVEADFRVIRCV